MKKLLFPAFLVLFTCTGLSAQTVQHGIYRYNYEEHGDRRQAHFVAKRYGQILNLSRTTERQIFLNLLDIYRRPVAWRYEYFNRSAKQVLDGATTHEILKERMKNILTESEYAAYTQIKSYPEVLFERGHW